MKKRKPKPRPEQRVIPVGTLVRVVRQTHIRDTEVGELGTVENHLYLDTHASLPQAQLVLHYVRMWVSGNVVSFHESMLEEVKDV